MLRLRGSLISFAATVGFLISVFTCQVCSGAPNHYVYVFPPGSIDVYDMDNNFALVKSVPFPLTKGQSPVYLRGAVASVATGMLYLSYGSNTSGGSMLKYDLVKDAIVWQQTYSFGIDSMSISPDGQKIYMPTGEGAYTQGVWEVIDANTGAVIGQIDSGGKGPHNTITSLSGSHVYMGPRYSNYLVLGDTGTLSVVRTIGPVMGTGGIRPFTIDGEEKYAYLTTSGFVGFEVSDISTGQNLYWVCPPGFCWTSGSFNSISGVAHGISLSPDEMEIYLIDLPYNHVHVFDVAGLPGAAPVDVADIPLNCTLSDEGWLQHSRDGRFVWVGDCGDVIDTSTRKIVANMPSLLNTRIFNEIDFLNGVPSFSPLSRNQGGYGSQPSSLTLSSTSLTFGSQTVGTASSAQSVTVSNSGTAAVSVTGVSLSGSNPGDFSQTNTCGTSIPAGANCSISVTFNPSASGTRTATISMADSDPSSPQSIILNGTGVAPTTTVTVSPASLTFASQTVGTSSASQTVTLTNTGNAALTITSISANGDFSETNGCGGSLAAGANCSISVAFTPTTSGTRTGALTIADNASGSPQTVSLSGTGATASTGNFSLSASTNSVSTTAGSPVSFTLSVTPSGGFNQTVAFACVGAPQAATCTVTPGSLALNGSSSSSATVTITTTARSILAPLDLPSPIIPTPGLVLGISRAFTLLTLTLAGLAACGKKEKARPAIGFAMLVLTFLAAAGCAASSPSVGSNSGTPAGTSVLTLTATSGTGANAVSHSTTVSLTVN